jgi:hypothetical protein
MRSEQNWSGATLLPRSGTRSLPAWPCLTPPAAGGVEHRFRCVVRVPGCDAGCPGPWVGAAGSAVVPPALSSWTEGQRRTAAGGALGGRRRRRSHLDFPISGLI